MIDYFSDRENGPVVRTEEVTTAAPSKYELDQET